jgi:hypothetical protein
LSDSCFNSTYRQGYFKALLDVKNWWENHSESIKYLRLGSYKGALLILEKLLEVREDLMLLGMDAEIGSLSHKDMEKIRGKKPVGKRR